MSLGKLFGGGPQTPDPLPAPAPPKEPKVDADKLAKRIRLDRLKRTSRESLRIDREDALISVPGNEGTGLSLKR